MLYRANARPIEEIPPVLMRSVADARQPVMADKKDTSSSIKYYVLDTNVLLHNPNAMFVFQENHIVIPYPVLEELDAMKRREDDVGRNARTAIVCVGLGN